MPSAKSNAAITVTHKPNPYARLPSDSRFTPATQAATGATQKHPVNAKWEFDERQNFSHGRPASWSMRFLDNIDLLATEPLYASKRLPLRHDDLHAFDAVCIDLSRFLSKQCFSPPMGWY
jgi:hypothetical protein